MNRTDRLYALVEELRSVSPRPRSARWLADRFEVSVRTIERDVSALQQAGTPIWAETGRSGGYCVYRSRTLPPVNFTAEEAVAMAVALDRVSGSPFAQHGRTALRKIVAAMSPADVARADDLATRVHLLGCHPAAEPTPPAPAALTDAVSAGRVLRLGYRDRAGAVTTREVEPVGLVVKEHAWYLVAWCRLRGGIRAFRADRVVTVVATSEVPDPREVTDDDLAIPYGALENPPLR